MKRLRTFPGILKGYRQLFFYCFYVLVFWLTFWFQNQPNRSYQVRRRERKSESNTDGQQVVSQIRGTIFSQDSM